eukprot:188864-Chlamydomonas_euryale.AAC.1
MASTRRGQRGHASVRCTHRDALAAKGVRKEEQRRIRGQCTILRTHCGRSCAWHRCLRPLAETASPVVPSYHFTLSVMLLDLLMTFYDMLCHSASHPGNVHVLTCCFCMHARIPPLLLAQLPVVETLTACAQVVLSALHTGAIIHHVCFSPQRCGR